MKKLIQLPAKLNVKDPRVLMRGIIGVLLLANLVMAVIAFKPFGGSADDLRREQQSLRAQLSQLQARVAQSKRLVEKVETARGEGDQFLGKYFMNAPTASAQVLTELTESAKTAGVKMGQVTLDKEPIEGSDTMDMQTLQVGFEGSYANLMKFVNLVDKSSKFMIIENLMAAAPQQQGGQTLNVALKILMFVKEGQA